MAKNDASQRRGQVAIYVLVGLAILLLVILGLFLRNILTGDELKNTLSKEATAPVENIVITCTEHALEQLLRTAGANGGYLDTSHLRHSTLAYDADVVDFTPQSVPYWSYLKPCQASALGCEASAQPPLCKETTKSCPINSLGAESVQEQLENALPEKVLECIGDFDALQEAYDITIERDEASADVLFTNDDVKATLHLPVKVTSTTTGDSRVLDEFTGTADVNLASLYRLSNDMANAEREQAFLEHLTLHLLSLYSGVNEALPPTRAVTLLGEKRYWSRTAVERTIQEEVLPWIDFAQVPNALAGFTPVYPPSNLSLEEQRYYAGIFYYLYVKVGEETYPDLKARFYYPGSKPYLSINGGQELLKPRSADVGGLLSKLTGVFTNDYRFNYDLAYPVIVTFTDTTAFNGEGYDWSFALEANIWRNKPVNRSGAVTNFRLTDERVDLSSPQQRVENTIRVETFDKQTGARLPGVRVRYACGQEFYVGETNAYGRLETRLPYCRYGGVLRYSKAGYLGSGVAYDNYEESITKQFTFELWPLKNVTLAMKKRTPEQVATLTLNTPTYESIRAESTPLNTTDLAIVNLERVKENPYDEDVPTLGFFTFSPAEQTFDVDIAGQRARVAQLVADGVLTENQAADWMTALEEKESENLTIVQPTVTVALAPGAYTIDGFLLHNERFTIPEETREFCIIGGGSLCAIKKEATLPETNFTTWMSGGIKLVDEQAWQLNPNTLYRFDTFTFYELEEAIPATWHDLESYQGPDVYLPGKELLMFPTEE